jgi:hypothetical protein
MLRASLAAFAIGTIGRRGPEQLPDGTTGKITNVFCVPVLAVNADSGKRGRAGPAQERPGIPKAAPRRILKSQR